VDRIGDTYRWKGENVSTEEVASVIATAPGIAAATVSSVAVPGAEGRAGLAAVLCHGEFDTEGFWRTAQGLPSYAQPRFVRVLQDFDTTGTFKVQKSHLRNDGVDPARVSDPLFVRTDEGYVPFGPELFDELQAQTLRL
jgi:acyl-CoA synthetase (AMP-forming)/AMP-acid ligase II